MVTVRFNRWLGSACCLIVGFGLLGCGGGGSGASSSGSASSTAEGESRAMIRVGLLPKIKGIAYFTSCAEGAREAADTLGGIELVYDGPIDGDPRKQAELIEQWTVDGFDVICVSPNAPDVVAGAMKEALDAGVHVITWDADGVAGSREFFVNQATPESIGQGMVRAMVEDLGGPEVAGDVVIISSDATAHNQNSWIAEMRPALEATRLRLATIKYPGENASQALADSKDVIRKYPELKGLFGISSVSFPGAAEAVDQMGKSGEILVTGLSTPNDMKPFVQRGTVKSVILWNTIDLGYLTVHVADALARGRLKPGAEGVERVERLEAGRLGEVEIDGDNVLLGDILVFTKDNIDEYDF